MKEYLLGDAFINDMKTILNLFKGKKTYIIGILMIALGVLQNNMELILEGSGLIALRLGVAK